MGTDTADPRRGFWNLLDTYEDYLSGGFARRHGAPPEFPRVVPLRDSDRDARAGGTSTDAEAGLPGAEDRKRLMEEIAAQVSVCRNCRLCENRTRAVPGTGVLDPLVMVIGEGPGEDEDRSGLPFVGAAGKYLDKWLEAIGLSREKNAFIANIVKCRPPKNRDPEQDEMKACMPYLLKQIALVRPKFLLTVGRVSTQALTGRTSGIGTLRGSVFTFEGIPLIPTYHPSGVLRNQDLRRAVWDDLKILKSMIDADGERGA